MEKWKTQLLILTIVILAFTSIVYFIALQYLAEEVVSNSDPLTAISETLGASLGVAISFAGALVAIKIAQSAHNLSEKEHSLDVLKFSSEEIIPASEQYRKLINVVEEVVLKAPRAWNHLGEESNADSSVGKSGGYLDVYKKLADALEAASSRAFSDLVWQKSFCRHNELLTNKLKSNARKETEYIGIDVLDSSDTVECAYNKLFVSSKIEKISSVQDIVKILRNINQIATRERVAEYGFVPASMVNDFVCFQSLKNIDYQGVMNKTLFHDTLSMILAAGWELEHYWKNICEISVPAYNAEDNGRVLDDPISILNNHDVYQEYKGYNIGAALLADIILLIPDEKSDLESVSVNLVNHIEDKFEDIIKYTKVESGTPFSALHEVAKYLLNNTHHLVLRYTSNMTHEEKLGISAGTL